MLKLFSLFTYIISISPNLVNQDTLTIFGKTNLVVSHIVLSYLGFNCRVKNDFFTHSSLTIILDYLNINETNTLTIFGKTNLVVSHIVLSYLGFNLGKETFSLSPLFYNYYTKLLHHQRDKHSY